MHVGVLAGEQRWSARNAGKRAGVMPIERHRVVVEPP